MIFAPVKEVKVYKNSAVVRRGAAVSLKAGTNVVDISGLGGRADTDSLRLFFPAGVIGTDVQILPYSEVAERLPSQDIADQVSDIESRIAALKTVEDLWIANGNFTEAGNCSLEMIESYLRGLPDNLGALRKQQRELSAGAEELKKKLREQQIKESFRVVRLILESAEDREASFEMEYSDSSASWHSTYEIHADSDADEIKVVSRATITQSSGEDWQDVRVSLYTGNPSARQDIPTLQKLSLRFKPEVVKREGFGSAPPMAQAMPAMMGMAMQMDAAMPKMTMEAAVEEEADTMTCFTLPGTRTVVTGTTGTMADLKTDSIPAEIKVVCVPKLDDNAYLAAIVKTADWPLKPSSAKIYLNENYCGEIYVSPELTEDKFTISLGRDERVSVKREEIRSRTEDVLLKGQKRKINEYSVRVANNRDKPLEVLVRDQIPVSTEKQIVVDHVETDGAALNEENGKLSWDLTIPGKSVVVKRLGYVVTYPKDKILQETWTNDGAGKICPSCGTRTTGKFCPCCGAIL